MIPCPLCGGDTGVRETRDERRRRECSTCRHRFTTIEVDAGELSALRKLADAANEVAHELRPGKRAAALKGLA